MLRGSNVARSRPFAWLVLLTVAWLAAPASAVLASTAADDPLRAVSMARLLSADDAERYRRLFALQGKQRWRAADKVAARLDDPVLLGHLLFERYMHPTGYRSRFGELRDWLAEYHDHPGASRVYRLASKRRPKGAARPRRPSTAKIPLLVPPQPLGVERRARRHSLEGRARGLARQVLAELKHDRPTRALGMLRAAHRRKALRAVEFDTIAAAIARSYYFNGRYERALKMASRAAGRSRSWISDADWFAGLAAWRLDDLEGARHHFDALARSDTAGADMVAAGAYWAARTNLVDHRPGEVMSYLAIASGHPRSFYGLVASRRLLARETGLDWTPAPLDQAALTKLLAIPATRRIVAFCEIGRHDLADAEMRHLLARNPKDARPVLMAIAERAGMPATLLRLARRQRDGGMAPRDGALYPLAPWRPEGGWKIDRALVNALIRRESNFKADARSAAGARGLMQLMPHTASYMAEDRRLRGRHKRRLLNPTYNLDLGQRYIAYLLAKPTIRGNLVLLAMAYNGGPANAVRWYREVGHGEDPLLMIESVPQRETRLFVKRILTDFWIYRDRLGQDTPSLDAVASSLWPYYVALDGKTLALARGGREKQR